MKMFDHLNTTPKPTHPGSYVNEIIDQLAELTPQMRENVQKLDQSGEPIASWIEQQLSFDFTSETSNSLNELEIGSDAFESLADDELIIDDAFIERWAASMGPFDLARAMMLEAVRDIAIGTPENRQSAVIWILDDDHEQGLTFELCVQWLTEACKLPGQTIDVVMPDDPDERVNHMRNACLQRPHEMYHLLKNYEDWSNYTKEKLETLREMSLPTARDLLLADAERERTTSQRVKA